MGRQSGKKPKERADGFLSLVHVSEMTRRGQGLPESSPPSVVPEPSLPANILPKERICNPFNFGDLRESLGNFRAIGR